MSIWKNSTKVLTASFRMKLQLLHNLWSHIKAFFYREYHYWGAWNWFLLQQFSCGQSAQTKWAFKAPHLEWCILSFFLMLDWFDYIYQINRNWLVVLCFRDPPENSYIGGEEKYFVVCQKGVCDFVITKKGGESLSFCFHIQIGLNICR